MKRISYTPLTIAFASFVLANKVLALPSTNTIAEPAADVNDVLEKSVQAVGGEDVLASIKGITYHAPNIYRSQTLTQSYNLFQSDQSVATAGAQDMSFDFTGPELRRRIDRTYSYGDYWIWAFPNLQPAINYTMISETGSNGFAYFVHGQNSFFSEDPTEALGYADGLLADFLTHQSIQFGFPVLLSSWKRDAENTYYTEVKDETTGLSFPAVTNPDVNLTIIFNSTSSMPHIIRSYEDNNIFGNSTSDLLLSDYKPVHIMGNTTAMLPHRFQTIYNSRHVIEDFVVESISVNPDFPDGYFLPSHNSSVGGHAPSRRPDYDRAEVHEFFETGLWEGPFDFNTSDVVAQELVPGSHDILSVYVGYADYAQMIVKFDEGVLITDAPPHRSKIIIQWVEENLGAEIKYVAPSHHHHDHAYGVGDYIAAGASLVIPEIARDYYSQVNGGDVTIITFNETHPFILKDDAVQFRAMYHDEPPHAKDWTYSIATTACPKADDGIVVFNADVWSPGTDGLRFDTGYAKQWLDMAVVDGLPLQSVVLGAHGDKDNRTSEELQGLIDILGYAYPSFNLDGWTAGGPLCA
ncbi:hypothetical protein F5Y19DRAFT_491630 [Xylariaceae sp. FL1651]|nr:hypothetical protein F5Y19DRAFT_491630 [Xylariaceae sp. FL1651]